MPYHCLNNGSFDCAGPPDWSIPPKEVKTGNDMNIIGGVCGNNWNECAKLKQPKKYDDMVTTGVHVVIKVAEKKTVEEKRTAKKKEKKETQQGSLF
jgi:hypothetical protein